MLSLQIFAAISQQLLAAMLPAHIFGSAVDAMQSLMLEKLALQLSSQSVPHLLATALTQSPLEHLPLMPLSLLPLTPLISLLLLLLLLVSISVPVLIVTMLSPESRPCKCSAECVKAGRVTSSSLTSDWPGNSWPGLRIHHDRTLTNCSIFSKPRSTVGVCSGVDGGWQIQLC
mmetsp:Transcript_30426/g.50363  ORF Transcript_30426/g.50363 Transcript_30426/m.50363 type:complete len:173 (-) Transcript_30426:925-1443(-)